MHGATIKLVNLVNLVHENDSNLKQWLFSHLRL